MKKKLASHMIVSLTWMVVLLLVAVVADYLHLSLSVRNLEDPINYNRNSFVIQGLGLFLDLLLAIALLALFWLVMHSSNQSTILNWFFLTVGLFLLFLPLANPSPQNVFYMPFLRIFSGTRIQQFGALIAAIGILSLSPLKYTKSKL